MNGTAGLRSGCNVLVEIQPMRNRPAAERRLLLDHRFERGQQMLMNLRLGLYWPISILLKKQVLIRLLRKLGVSKTTVTEHRQRRCLCC
jgi:hypothetical protein